MSLKTTTDQNFEADVLKNKKPVLVDFWAEWCGPCRALMPVLESLHTEMGDRVDIIKANIDDNPNTPATYGVRSIPTLLLFKDGEIVDTKTGPVSQNELADWIDSKI